MHSDFFCAHIPSLCICSFFVHLYFLCGRHPSLTPFVKRSESEQDLIRRGESVVEHWEGEGILVKHRKKSIFPLTIVPLKSDHIIKTRKLQQDQKLPGRTSRRGENKSSRSQVLRSQKREGLTRTLMYLTSRLRRRKTDQKRNPGGWLKKQKVVAVSCPIGNLQLNLKPASTICSRCQHWTRIILPNFFRSRRTNEASLRFQGMTVLE